MNPRPIPLPVALLALALPALLPASLSAQTIHVAVARENFRQQPSGSAIKLATVLEDAPLDLVDTRGRWRQVVLQGWIWEPSVRGTDRDGFDLVVSAEGGENLRATPNGERLAILLEGCLLERLGAVGNWVQVQRQAWIWGPSVSEPVRSDPSEASAAYTVDGEDAEGAASADSTAGAAGTAGAPSGPGAGSAEDRLVVGSNAVHLHRLPDGDTLAMLRPGAGLRVVARRGSWARVQVDGWVWVPATVPADSAGLREDLGIADVRADPAEYEGARIHWEVQFISLERAEPVRTDFYEGEPFLLTRGRGEDEGFVYIAVPPELLSAAGQLRPLQTIEVLARVRTGRSALMGAPVLDLLAFY